MIPDGIFQFSLGTKIVHGRGANRNVGQETRSLGVSRVLLVADPGVRAAGLVDPVAQSLADAGLPAAIYDEADEDPGPATIHRALEALHAAQADGVVVIGGGSAMSVAKGAALLATNGGQVSDYYGDMKYRVASLPLVAIPTTCGAGSEVSAIFPVKDDRTGEQCIVRGPAIYPRVAILDPENVRNLPYRTLVNSGVDALTHAMEACWTNQATPLTDAIALEAIRMIAHNFVSAALEGSFPARGEMLLASTMANIACGNAKLALAHAFTQVLTSFDVPHGLGLGVVLPHVMAFNLPVCPGKLAAIARAMGEPADSRTEAELAQAAVERVKGLLRRLDYPKRLSAEAVPPSDIPRLAELTSKRTQARFNIRPSTHAELEALYRQAYDGWDSGEDDGTAWRRLMGAPPAASSRHAADVVRR